MTCPKCGRAAAHFVPPSLGEAGFYICEQTDVGTSLVKMDKWDIRFMRLAQEVSTWSKDPSTQVGAVLVSPDRSDIVLGYNGFPRRMSDAPELYNNREQKYGRIIHGEMNAVLMARRPVAGYTLYTWPMLSCDRCAVHMVQAGIARAVGPKPLPDQASRWEKPLGLTRQYFAEAGIQICEYDRETLLYAPNFFS